MGEVSNKFGEKTERGSRGGAVGRTYFILKGEKKEKVWGRAGRQRFLLGGTRKSLIEGYVQTEGSQGRRQIAKKSGDVVFKYDQEEFQR